jgi:antitoxin VapB
MIKLSPETVVLAKRLAAARGVSPDEAIRQAIEQYARDAGMIEPRRRVTSPEAIARRKAATQRIVDEIKTMPLLDPHSSREIIDNLWQ